MAFLRERQGATWLSFGRVLYPREKRRVVKEASPGNLRAGEGGWQADIQNTVASDRERRQSTFGLKRSPVDDARGGRPWWTPVVAPIRLLVNIHLMKSALVKEG